MVASIPVSLLQSNLSHGACRLYALLTLLPTYNGRFWISQNHLGEQLKCSTRHVRNFLKELEEAKFLENTGDYHGQYRVYKLQDSGTRVPPIKLNLNSNSNLNSINLLAQNPSWKTEYACFDGKEGRPTLVQKIDEALKRFRYGNLLGYVKFYLKQGAQWLLANLARLHNIVTAAPAQTLQDIERERQAQETKKRAYNNRFWPKDWIQQPEEDQSFIRAGFKAWLDRVQVSSC